MDPNPILYSTPHPSPSPPSPVIFKPVQYVARIVHRWAVGIRLICLLVFTFFYRQQTKLRGGNVFTGVCLSFCSGRTVGTGRRYAFYWNAFLSHFIIKICDSSFSHLTKISAALSANCMFLQFEIKKHVCDNSHFPQQSRSLPVNNSVYEKPH